MDIIKLTRIDSSNKKLVKKLDIFEKLLEELQKREIVPEIAEMINIEIEKVNSFLDLEKAYSKVLVKSRTNIIKIIEKELGLFVKNHHQQKLMSVGIALGLAFGSAFGASQDNMGLMALGLPIGMAVGITIGKKKDDEVFKLGNQLDVEVEV